jgi:hypothetical protein
MNESIRGSSEKFWNWSPASDLSDEWWSAHRGPWSLRQIRWKIGKVKRSARFVKGEREIKHLPVAVRLD